MSGKEIFNNLQVSLQEPRDLVLQRFMQTTALDELEFRATFVEPMRNVAHETTDVIDIWRYVDSIPDADLQGHEINGRFVECVYRNATGQFDHVLVLTKAKDVYLVVVVNLIQECVHGHKLLDLNMDCQMADKPK